MTLPEGKYSLSEISWFREIFDLYYESIRSFAYFKTGDAAFADDVVQETFLKVWSFRSKIHGDRVKPLLYTIAGNIIKNQFKHLQVVYRFEKQSASTETAESADSHLLSEEFNQKLQRALAQIPEGPRMVFLMNRIEGLTYSEIAERLNLSVKAIEKRMSEAIKVLRSQIDFKI